VARIALVRVNRFLKRLLCFGLLRLNGNAPREVIVGFVVLGIFRDGLFEVCDAAQSVRPSPGGWVPLANAARPLPCQSSGSCTEDRVVAPHGLRVRLTAANRR